MRFMIFVIDGETNTANKNEIEQIDKFNASLAANNQLVMAAGLAGPYHATLIDNRNNAGRNEPGSLFKTPEFFSGFWIIDADSKETAQGLAVQASLACNRRVELRPFL